jgi:sugar phosphate isomerase/epimerase
MSVLSAALAVALSASFQIPSDNLIDGFAMGCQAWSFNHFTAVEAVEKTAAAGAHVIEFFPGQKVSPTNSQGVGPEMSESSMTELETQLRKFNVKAVAFGVTGIDQDVTRAEPLFQWAKRMGIGILNTESTESLDTIEAMVKKYDIRVGFHDHPRRKDDPAYRMWDPSYVLSIVKSRDRRIGACADTGHWVRSGIKPLDALRILDGRIISCHLKDLNVFSADGHDVPYGTGVSDVAGILKELKRQKFNGSISVEYEYNWDNSLPEIAQCIGFVRGMGAR